MLISEVIDGVKAYCGHDWGGPIMDDTTRDQVLWGPVDVECTGIVTTCFASADVIRQAHARGANLIICHEALFWNHGDHTCWLAGNKTFAAKRALLEECGITVWRLHDHIHSGIPEDGRLVDGIFMGLADKLGWRDCVRGDTARPMEFEIPETSAGELARFRREQLGFIFQDSNLLDTLTARENIALPLTISRVSAGETLARVEEMARRLNIADVLDKYPYQLSGGQQQRVAAARALVTKPAVIMADEPTGALDSKSARLLLESLQQLNEERDATILMVTHDSFAASYTGRVLFIRDGKIFTELRRGSSPRREFFDRIMEVVAMMGGEGSDAL